MKNKLKLIIMQLEPEVLTHPNVPKPLHGLNPRSIKGTEWWDKVRQVAYASTDYHCIACGVHKSKAKYHNWLEAHEYYDINYEIGKVELKKIIPLCHSCHNFIHSGYLTIQLKQKKISFEKLKDIIRHGCNILTKNNLKGFPPTIEIAKKLNLENIPEEQNFSEIKSCEWSKWHLVLDGEIYKTPFKSFEEWKNHKW